MPFLLVMTSQILSALAVKQIALRSSDSLLYKVPKTLLVLMALLA